MASRLVELLQQDPAHTIVFGPLVFAEILNGDRPRLLLTRLTAAFEPGQVMLFQESESGPAPGLTGRECRALITFATKADVLQGCWVQIVL